MNEKEFAEKLYKVLKRKLKVDCVITISPNGVLEVNIMDSFTGLRFKYFKYLNMFDICDILSEHYYTMYIANEIVDGYKQEILNRYFY